MFNNTSILKDLFVYNGHYFLKKKLFKYILKNYFLFFKFILNINISKPSKIIKKIILKLKIKKKTSDFFKSIFKMKKQPYS